MATCRGRWKSNWNPILLILLVAVLCYVSCREEEPSRNYQLPQHDGKRRVVELTESNFGRLKKNSELLVIHFEMPHYGQEDGKRSAKFMRDMLELTAQLSESKGVKVATLDIVKQIGLAQKITTERQYPGYIATHYKGNIIPFHGHRSVEVLSVFIMRLLEDPVYEIDGKSRKKLYDSVELPKVIGYFEGDESKEYKAFEEAAIPFRPLMMFYSVFNKKIAKTLRLKKQNTITFTKPYEKPIHFKGELTKNNLIDFIKKNKKQQLTKLHVESLHENWPIFMNGYLIAAFIRPKSHDGAKFFPIVKSLAKQYRKNEKTAFIWVDPDEFPNVSDMHEYWRSGFNINIENNIIGVVNVTSNESTWYRRTAEDKTTVKDLSTWLDDVMDGSVMFDSFNSKARHPKKNKQEL
ncbi:Calsequestrin-2 [Trichoplax sp. H2]|nr:Calsequestrin-2 [Trichoplax sp. H2]|eukprot:RDD44487.1 Calsequestrin-2 [Trichoplax sp. H2]